MRCAVHQVRRLVPGQDAASFLAASPGAVLSMAQAGLESTTDGNLVPCDTPRRARDATDG